MIPLSDPSSTQCPLCQEKQIEKIIPDINNRVYWRCPSCFLIFIDSNHLPAPQQEKARYDLHQNENTDTTYLSFLSPMIDSIKPYIHKTMLGLDYGCGPNPVLADMLRSQGYSIFHYDPYYFPIIDRINFDFVLSTEVVEHFHKVEVEWTRLIDLVNQGGYLGIMTHMYDDVTDLKKWYYMRDFTHTAFYHSQTFSFIAQHWKLKLCIMMNSRIAILQKM